jgi:hypothetical protein
VNAIVGVYRQHNLEHVQRLIAPALSAGWKTAWWALDGTVPELADVAVGEGPGEKLPLVNRALATLPTADWTVVADDDVAFHDGNVVEFVWLCEMAGFDLAQPARVRGTHISHKVTEQCKRSRARLTTFVESGPLYVVGPRYRDRILPLPEHRGMGWGLAFDWYDLHREGVRLGILDELPMVHVTGRISYDYHDMNQRYKAEAAERGHPHWETLQVWRTWQTHAPWLTGQ